MSNFLGSVNSGDSGFTGTNTNNFNSGVIIRKSMGEQTMRSVTIKQLAKLSSHQDNVFRIDDADVTQITFVGIIRHVQELSTNFSYSIEDGTGVVEVRKWIEQNETAEEFQIRQELAPDAYVRVCGKPNNFNNRVSVICFSIRPVKDFNEISYHMLEAIYTHLSLTKSHPFNVTSGRTMEVDTGVYNTLVADIHRRVMDILKEHHHLEEGANTHHIIKRLQGSFTVESINDAITYLSNEGHCYTTIDDDHIKSTES